MPKADQRRRTSCLPCRLSKSKCSGGIPCSTCQRKRSRPICLYDAESSGDSDNNGNALTPSFEPTQLHDSGDSVRQGTTCDQARQGEVDDDDKSFEPPLSFYGHLSLPWAIEAFKSPKFTGAHSYSTNVITSINILHNFNMSPGHDPNPSPTEDVRLEQLTSALGPRLHLSTDLEPRPSKPLRHMHAKFMSVARLFEEGRVIEAWTGLSGLICVAELIGCQSGRLNQDGPAGDKVEFPRRMWWLLKDLDARVSLMLGRPPRTGTTLHGETEIPRPSLKSLPDEEKTLRRNVQDFSSLVLEATDLVTGSKPHAPDDAYARALESCLLRLREHQAQLPLLQQDPHTATSTRVAIADHQIEVQLFEIVVRCALVRWFSAAAAAAGPKPTTLGDEKGAGRGRKVRSSHDNKVRNTVNCLLQSARIVSDTFAYIHDIDSGLAVSSWPRCFGLYCAAVMLAVSRLRRETELDEDVFRVERALDVFRCRSATFPQSDMAPSAVETLSELLRHIGLLVSARGEGDSTMSQDEGAASSMPPRDDSPPILSQSQGGGKATHADAKRRGQLGLRHETTSGLQDNGHADAQWREQFFLEHETTSVLQDIGHGGRNKRTRRPRKDKNQKSKVQGPVPSGAWSLQDDTPKPPFSLAMATDISPMTTVANYDLSMPTGPAQAQQLSYPNGAVTPFGTGGWMDVVPTIRTRPGHIDSAQPLDPRPFAHPPMWTEGPEWTEQRWQPQNALFQGGGGGGGGGPALVSNEQRGGVNPHMSSSLFEQYQTGFDNCVPMAAFRFPVVPAEAGFPPPHEHFRWPSQPLSGPRYKSI